MFKVNEYETDVLVIGGAGAGLRAALEASRKDVKVMLVSKGRVARSGCTVLCTAGLSAALEELGDHPDFHYADSLKAGEYLNDRELLATLAYDSPKRLVELYQLGANLLKKNGRPIPYGKSGGHSHPRNFRAVPESHLGIEITSCLFKAAKAAGVSFVDRVYATDLISADARITGSVGVSLDRSELLVIKAKSTVIATGGGAAIYSKTDNPKDMVGDGHFMAWRAGAQMLNMEFVMFHPAIPLRPRAGPFIIPSLTWIARDGAVLRNKMGEDIIQKHAGTSFAAVYRDHAARYEAIEISAGRGIHKGIYLDATDLDPTLIKRKYSHLLKACLEKGVDIRKEPMVISPGSHSFVGGARINKYCETTVPGLYAAGEAAGGIHGAHELPGNHLADAQVFGAIAGEQAALAAGRGKKVKWHKSLIADSIKEIETMVGPASHDLKTMVDELRGVMWEGAGIIRTKSSLKRTVERINHYKQLLPDIKAEGKSDFLKLLSLRSMVAVADMIVTCALKRKESRGSHYREDFPSQDDAFLGNTILTRKADGTMGTQFRPLKGRQTPA
jgi:fumarate reductase (CoM/CoB) subunit A